VKPPPKTAVAAINANGDVLFAGPPPTVQRGGRSQELPLPAGFTGDARPAAISDGGAVVAGSIALNPGADIVTSRPVVWRC
jgi:hypothetical protein